MRSGWDWKMLFRFPYSGVSLQSINWSTQTCSGKIVDARLHGHGLGDSVQEGGLDLMATAATKPSPSPD